MSKVKLALVCSAATLKSIAPFPEVGHVIEIPEAFWGIPTFLEDRAVCETQPALLQLIPYVVLKNELGQVFGYTRGTGGAEDRLHSKISLGLGGHVDAVVPENCTLQSWMCVEAQRELLEEIGHVPHIEDFSHLIFVGTDAVGEVHLGILSIVQVHSADVSSCEVDTITEGKWYELAELTGPEIAPRLEPWSAAALTVLIDASAN